MRGKIVIRSSIDNISRVYIWLESLLEERVDEALSSVILLVTQEITTNAILHGNRLSPYKRVTIEVSINSMDIIVEVTDEGEGIKSLPSKREAKELDYLAENGRGLKLAVLMSDKIELDGTTVRTIFKI